MKKHSEMTGSNDAKGGVSRNDGSAVAWRNQAAWRGSAGISGVA